MDTLVFCVMLKSFHNDLVGITCYIESVHGDVDGSIRTYGVNKFKISNPIFFNAKSVKKKV